MLSPFVIGPVERTQSLQESWFGGAGNDAAGNRSAALVEISIDCAGSSHAAFGRCPEAAAYLLDLLLSHVTSAPAGQHSILVIHAFSPFIIGSGERALARQKEVFTRDWLYIGAALAHESISVQAAVF